MLPNESSTDGRVGMADYQSIQQLIYRYAYAHNERDAGALRDCLAKDARLQRAEGRENVIDAYQKLWDGQVNFKRRHVMANIFLIEESEREAITMTTVLVFWIENQRDARLGGIARYRDRVVLEDGQWRIQDRQVALDTSYLPGDQPGIERGFDLPDDMLSLVT